MLCQTLRSRNALPLRYPTVDAKVLASHVGAGVARQENTPASDIIWHRDSSIHYLVLPTLKEMRELFVFVIRMCVDLFPFVQIVLTGAVISVLT
jgi:hypothetical protein